MITEIIKKDDGMLVPVRSVCEERGTEELASSPRFRNRFKSETEKEMVSRHFLTPR